MTVVVGTAGHIDHGKTTLLRALTGIDADRLPEERARGMTIDVGYAHLAFDDGTTLDFVDVPGHDRLVGNMLVGAGEVDAALLVVAADDGPRAQTFEHLALLDALGIAHGLAVITKIDAVDDARIAAVTAEVERLLGTTSLAGRPVLAASGRTGEGLDPVRAALAALREEVRVPSGQRPPTLAIDRAFAIKGRGAVVTGTLRGGPLARGDTLRLLPDDRAIRVREIQVHGTAVEQVVEGGRTALNLAGVGVDALHRGHVLTADPAVQATDRILVAFDRPVADRTRARFHSGTAAIDASVGRAGRDALELGAPEPGAERSAGSTAVAAGIVRLASPAALAPGDRFVLRRGGGSVPVGGVVLDVGPARGVSRRRQDARRVGRLADTVAAGERAAMAAARTDLHGIVMAGGRAMLATDLAADAATAATTAATTDFTEPGRNGARLADVRSAVASCLRRRATIRRDAAAAAAQQVVDDLVEAGQLVRDGDTVRRPGDSAREPDAVTDPALAAAMARLEAALAVPAPPPLADAARTAGCPPGGIRELERTGRIAVLAPDLAYAMATYRDLAAQALAIASREPLTPAAFRDATGTSRKYVMAVLEDLDRRGILRRTAAGHVPGPRAPSGDAAAIIDRPSPAPTARS